jgi:hypothetical protein
MHDPASVALAAVSLLLFAGFLALLAVLWCQSKRPETETDRACARIDRDLDERRAFESRAPVRRWNDGWS